MWCGVVSLKESGERQLEFEKGFRCPSRVMRETPEGPKGGAGVTREEYEGHQEARNAMQVSLEREMRDTRGSKR